MIVGLTGELQSGKDTIYQRAKAVHPERWIERRAFADKLKESACALFDVSLEELESFKNSEGWPFIVISSFHGEHGRHMAAREVLQRYGTEAHRDVFGKNFWVDACLPHNFVHRGRIIFVTDVRFENEAQRIKSLGGEVWQVLGQKRSPDKHSSEAGIKDDLIDHYIDNRTRDDDFTSLDGQIKLLMNSERFMSRVPPEVTSLH